MKAPTEYLPQLVGVAGLLAMLNLERANQLIALLVGVASFAYIVTKEIKLIRKDKDK